MLASLGEGNDIPLLATRNATLGTGTVAAYRQATTMDKKHITDFGLMTESCGQQAIFAMVCNEPLAGQP